MRWKEDSMNLSGKAVNYWIKAEKIPLENLLVVSDDLALPFGHLRMRKKGSNGGHNGLLSVEECLNTSAFCRLRVGISSSFSLGGQIDYVLGKIESEDLKQLPAVLDNACCILLVVQRKKFVPIANNFWEIVYISGYSLFIIINSSYSLKHLPQADFTDFRAGTDLVAGNAEASDLKYNTVFIYSKNGKEIKFDINHLPDST